MTEREYLPFLTCRAGQRKLTQQMLAKVSARESLHGGIGRNLAGEQIHKPIDRARIIGGRFTLDQAADQGDNAGLLRLNVSEYGIQGPMIT